MNELPPSPRRGGAQSIPRPASWRSGGAGRWTVVRPISTASIADAVAAVGRGQAEPSPHGASASAVLVVLVDGTNGAEVLLTKRSDRLRNHPGEISFPGGRLDGNETTTEAALREAGEEVGLAPGTVRVIGELTELSTVVSHSSIVPVVASVATRPALVPHEPEVSRILWVPLVDLAHHATYREELWGTPPSERRMDFFELDDETIWGATARVLRELLEVVYSG